MDKFLIQLQDKQGAIVDVCTFKTEASFRNALKSDWANLWGTTTVCWDITDVLNPVRL